MPDDWQCPLSGLRKSDLRLLPAPPAVSSTASAQRPGGSARGTARNGDWDLVEQDDQGARMEYRGSDGLGGFVLAGQQAQFGLALYREVHG